MEALLPSEIARLVLGYLQDQKCSEAAKIFLETCPHLQECRSVMSNGRRFSTKVNGMTLLDMLEKLSAVNTIIQERVNKTSDCEQLKHCNDLLDQLKYLVEEPRGQRFVVNINVPSQANSQMFNNSPIFSSCYRKRRHSNSDRERNKRHKTPASSTQEPEDDPNPRKCDTVEATPLEALPGHTETRKVDESLNFISENKDTSAKSSHQASVSFNRSNSADSNSNANKLDKQQGNKGIAEERSDSSAETESRSKKNDASTSATTLEKCTAATSTEELLSVSCAEVQTTPYDTPESESETNDEPIENLSLLTKELLNRTELQERIAENINKAILPVEPSSKDETLNDSVNTEGNTSIMTELNNAIKSIVEATEADPVFEQFLDDIIGPNGETDTSPDEDGDPKSIKEVPNEGPEDMQLETPTKNADHLETTATETNLSNEVKILEVPLKQRLRSSSRQQNALPEDTVDKHREPEKEHDVLENQNAAAVMSIINITNNSSECVQPIANISEPTGERTRDPILCDESVPKSITSVPEVVGIANPSSFVPRKQESAIKRIRPTKVKRDSQVDINEFLSEQDIMAMPTLIVCSKEDISNILTTNTNQYAFTHTLPSNAVECREERRFLPIAPKQSSKPNDSNGVYLRSMQVPPMKAPLQCASKDFLSLENPLAGKAMTTLTMMPQKSSQVNVKVSDNESQAAMATVTSVPVTGPPVPVPLSSSVPITMPVPMPLSVPVQLPLTACNLTESINELEPNNKAPDIEDITLYGTENVARTTFDSVNVPTIDVEENITLSGTGLSPYLKFSSNKSNTNHSLSEIELPVLSDLGKSTVLSKSSMSSINEPQPSTSKCEMISKRTPKSLLKSRSKNHRLSLSTPRRRRSHIRALDFNTPMKRNSRSISENEADEFSVKQGKRAKSVCRTSLFKSPTYLNNTVSGNQPKTPVNLCSRKVPIATRSPRPKLIGGWEKYNGVGVIIGEVSPQASDEYQSSVLVENQPKPKLKTAKSSWDADLRSVLQSSTEEKFNSRNTTVAKRKPMAKGKSGTAGKNKKSVQITKVKSKINEKTSKVVEDNNKDDEKKMKQQSSELGQDNPEKETICEGDNDNTEKKDVNPAPEKKENSQKSQPIKPNVASRPSQTGVKKYAQVKTIRTTVTESKSTVEDSRYEKCLILSSTALSQHTEFTKKPVDISHQVLPISEIVDLETPRKLDSSCGIPITPRLLSPSSNIVTPFVKISDDSSKMRSFISTPEFPTTPCIALTPKHIQENTQDTGKKNGFSSCSPYYQPSSDQEGNPENLTKVRAPTSEDPTALPIGLKINTAKLEITQFEVIKENLPKEEAVKELKISNTSKDSSVTLSLALPIQDHSKNENIKPGDDEEENIEDPADDSSSNSDTSSDSDSSSSSSCSSTASSTTNVSSYSEEYAAGKKSRRLASKIYTDTSNDSGQRRMRVTRSAASEAARNAGVEAVKSQTKPLSNVNNVESVPHVEIDTAKICHQLQSSPIKVIPIVKTEEQLQQSMKETPAKDETLLNEADISETPSSSKSGMEIVTNLSSKISALISSGEENDQKYQKSSHLSNTEKPRVSKPKQKPSILSVQEMKSNVIAGSLTCTVIGGVSNAKASSNKQNTDDRLTQLEAKRQRMIAKFREAPKSTGTRGRGRRRTVFKGRTVGGLRTENLHPKKDESNNNDTRIRVAQGSKTLQSANKIASCNNHGNHDLNLPGENKRIVDTNISNKKDLGEKVEDVSMPATAFRVECKLPKDIIDSDLLTQDEKKTGYVLKDILRNPSEHIGQLVVDEPVQNNLFQPEGPKNVSGEYAHHIDKVKCTFKAKVDQVKRDLFSDEEHDHRGSSLTKEESGEEKSRNSGLSSSEQKTVSEEVSDVLQCLELVPTSKTDQLQGLEDEDEVIDENEREEACINSSINVVEYHFVYDERAPVKKRRRRYSNQDLEFHLNITNEMNEQCMKLMTPTDFVEIFNISPKMKKRPSNKKSPHKLEKLQVKQTDGPRNSMSSYGSKIAQAKPLATSTPMEKPNVHKLKKLSIKVQRCEKISEMDAEVKKKMKYEKTHASEKDTACVKNRKRKTSESWEDKQVDKKSSTTNTQALLSNLDVDKFLTSVHGPE